MLPYFTNFDTFVGMQTIVQILCIKRFAQQLIDVNI